MKKAKATPTKDFFVRMITRDISLEDSLLDLIDNCLDGARRTATVNDGDTVDSYAGFCASLRIGPDEFTIEDNCGGISISNAIDYAFHFGRRRDAPDDADFAIGLYGIGMKRAIFKIGSDIGIHSSTPDEAFRCTILVDDWLRHDRWEFDMDDAALINGTGTAITIRVLKQRHCRRIWRCGFCQQVGPHCVAGLHTLYREGFQDPHQRGGGSASPVYGKDQ